MEGFLISCFLKVKQKEEEMAKILIIHNPGRLADEYWARLTRAGYNAYLNTTRESGLSSLEMHGPFDLILLNHSLEEETTVGLVRDIRRSHRDRRVVVLKTIQGPAVVVEFMKAGAQVVVDKPLDPEGIVEIVEQHLGEE